MGRAWVALLYRWRHGRWPDFDRPTLFTEWVQRRKLDDRDQALARLTDKLAGKAIAVERLGAARVIPTLWSGARLPADPPGGYPLMVKANHGCGQYRVVRDLADWRRAARAARAWRRRPYGGLLGEWHYRGARRLALVEPLVGDGRVPPLDYKVYVFAGRAAVVQLHLGRGTGRHRWIQFDRDWTRLSAADGAPDPAPPVTLGEMLAAAEAMAGELDFVRVDFYEVEGGLLFGEYCLFPGSGLDPFDPRSIDERLGDAWAAARSAKERL
ncbi:ATP-grasp fold amidoligase family protein [Sphingomonas sp. ASV193]|uniref:ATP-grasp fold amidoligase family protein n=1 Tax=Sphingomonas sp. ASV193 TaxID=3144405 RepID=UPI0032E929C7